jgi:hypothetical protein
MSRTIFVLTGQTDSGDDIGPYAWSTEPTEEQVLAVFVRDIPEEVEAGCCDWWRVEKTMLEEENK